MSERCETDKTPQAKANATDKFNSIARHNQRHCLFDNAATTNQAIFSAIFNSLLVARDHDRIVGLALMTRHRQTRRSVIASRGFYLHETGDPQFDAITMEYNGFLVQRDRSEEIIRAFLDYLVDVVTDCDEFYLSGVGTSYEKFAADTGLTVYCRRRSPCHYVDLVDLRDHEKGSFPYLSANSRSQLRRAIRFYEKRGHLSVELPPSIDTALHFWEELIEFHQSYWRKRGQPGAFSNPFFEALHRHLIVSHFDEGKVRRSLPKMVRLSKLLSTDCSIFQKSNTS